MHCAVANDGAFLFEQRSLTMKRRKKFKTIAGYLRSMEQDLWHRQGMAELNGKPGIADDDGHRFIVNNLLSQIERAGSIGPAETPRDGVKRLRATAINPAEIEALDACAKWLDKPGVKVAFVGTRSEVTSVSVTYAGKHYTQQKFEVFEKLQREHGCSLDQAIAMSEQAAKAG